MKDVFKDQLFARHILVHEDGSHTRDYDKDIDEAFNTVLTLAHKFGIRITKGARLANRSMIRDAEVNLGGHVSEPFYRGFPETVREMTPDKLLYDQLLHYTQTYGMGWFDQPGHSLFEENDAIEERYRKMNEHSRNFLYQQEFLGMAFEQTKWAPDSEEKTAPKDFVILMENEANEEIKRILKDLLSGNRPLNKNLNEFIHEGWLSFGTDILPEKIPCKQTVIHLLDESRNLVFTKYLMLSDTIKLVEYIQYHRYHSENMNQLNLKNQDRKFITRVIDSFFEATDGSNLRRVDTLVCYEKRKIWCGLLHHIHYQQKTDANKIYFCDSMRHGPNRSAYSDFERVLKNHGPAMAARTLKDRKGSGAVLRNMNYLLSRCSDEEEVKGVLEECLE